MKDQTGLSPYWLENLKAPHFSPLQKDEKADVCIIGAGIAGLTVAYNLLKQGKSVIVLEMNKIASGESLKSTAHISSVLDERYYHLAKLFPNDVEAIAESHVKAIDEIERIVKKEKIECDFKRVDGFLFLSHDKKMRELEKEFEAIQKINFKTAELLEEGPIPSLGPCIRFPGQAEFHPYKYLVGLSSAIKKNGGQIYTETKAVSFNTAASPIKVVTSDGRLVESDALVVATNTPIDDRLIMHTKQAAYRTYVIAGWIPRDALPLALFWDTEVPYHYIRIYRDPFNQLEDLLIIGGEDHKTGQMPKISPFIPLEAWARNKFPLLDKISYCWSGQVIEPVDDIAFIGKNPLDNSNVYIATGASGNGITYGTIAGMLIPDLIIGKRNHWEKIYSPRRKNIKSIKEYLSENFNVFIQYLKWLIPVKRDSANQLKNIPPKSGIILQDGLQKYAYYRDEDGILHKLSARCTHLDGLVSWNDIEKSWDCPCHGTRYSADGRIINGPAVKDLKKY